MDEQRFEAMLASAIRVHTLGRAKVQTFERAGIVTDNRGLVVKVDGKTYQVTVVEEP